MHIKDFEGEVVSMHFANSRWLMLVAFQIFTSVQLRHAKEGLVWTDAPGRIKFCERDHRVVTCEVKNNAETLEEIRARSSSS